MFKSNPVHIDKLMVVGYSVDPSRFSADMLPVIVTPVYEVIYDGNPGDSEPPEYLVGKWTIRDDRVIGATRVCAVELRTMKGTTGLQAVTLIENRWKAQSGYLLWTDSNRRGFRYDAAEVVAEYMSEVAADAISRLNRYKQGAMPPLKWVSPSSAGADDWTVEAKQLLQAVRESFQYPEKTSQVWLEYGICRLEKLISEAK